MTLGLRDYLKHKHRNTMLKPLTERLTFKQELPTLNIYKFSRHLNKDKRIGRHVFTKNGQIVMYVVDYCDALVLKIMSFEK